MIANVRIQDDDRIEADDRNSLSPTEPILVRINVTNLVSPSATVRSLYDSSDIVLHMNPLMQPEA